MIAAMGLMCAAQLGGCLVPLPLEQQNPVDGGNILIVKAADPPFGVLRPMTSTTAYRFSINVQSDSANLSGRLFLQVNQSCCDLRPDDPKSTRFLGNSISAQVVSPEEQIYRISFGTAVPCDTFSGVTTYLVPVLTSGGFLDGPEGTQPQTKGTADQTHYWSVACP